MSGNKTGNGSNRLPPGKRTTSIQNKRCRRSRRERLRRGRSRVESTVERRSTRRPTTTRDGRRELVRKRARLERMHLREGPPRKRQTERISVKTAMERCVEFNHGEADEVKPSTTGVRRCSECDAVELDDAKPSTSGVFRSFESCSEEFAINVDVAALEYKEDKVGTSDADTVPNSPYSSPSRPSTLINLANVARRPVKIKPCTSSSESE